MAEQQITGPVELHTGGLPIRIFLVLMSCYKCDRLSKRRCSFSFFLLSYYQSIKERN